MKNLPIGIQTLARLREDNCVYVDKTKIAFSLISRSGAYFLSRPRRFGKSLFLDTLKEIFQGNQKLFQGLYIENRWNWSKTYPVIKIDFAGGHLTQIRELDEKIFEILEINQKRLGVTCRFSSGSGCFGELIRNLHHKTGRRVVILIDEYDKPILDNIEDTNTAKKMREGLRNLYSVMKSEDEHIQFIFMTGVSKFSKVSLFSGLNNLKDITIDAKYATICGYTHPDVESCFADHLKGVDWQKFKRWYNGYQWLGQAVYNPYDVLLFIDSMQMYRAYWFETGSPSFLISLFQEKQYFLPDMETIEVGEEILDSFDVESIRPETLLFQSGYLTIDDIFTRHQRLMFRLKIPNMEVQLALNDHLINGYTDLVTEKFKYQDHLFDALSSGDPPALEQVIKRLFAGIPWRNFTNNDLMESEGYYASVLYAFFASLNARIIPEDITCRGQADLTVIIEKKIYVMEIKLIKNEDSGHEEMMKPKNPALAQIMKRGYSEKYRNTPGRTVYELGMVFSRVKRNLIRFDWREVEATT